MVAYEPDAGSGPIRIAHHFQGPAGWGQGGWTAQRFAARLDGPVSIALKAPIPLDTDLEVTGDGTDGHPWRLVAPAVGGGLTVVMEARPWTPSFPTTEPVPVDEARAARERFEYADDPDHPVASCFSCGAQPDTMRVHPGPLGDGRWASDWTVPDWAAEHGTDGDGRVDEGVLWAAVDCTAAWYVATSAAFREVVTAQYAVEVLHPVVAGETYALVGWSGDHPAAWDGRKRHAASAAFAADGTCVARSVSFWISL